MITAMAATMGLACQSAANHPDYSLGNDIEVFDARDDASVSFDSMDEHETGTDIATQDDSSDLVTKAGCPTPVILVKEGEEVRPQVVIHLHGEQSLASTGLITSYKWSVEQPANNTAQFVPDNRNPTPTHMVDVSGTYRYCLDVCDAQRCSNEPGCGTTACRNVAASCRNAIYCELTWDTPGDPNQFDEGPGAGADMDVHFLDPRADGPDLNNDGKGDGWFDPQYDVFWGNMNPVWGVSHLPGSSYGARMYGDDTDGAGPEAVYIDIPEAVGIYRIGVHYWADHGYGYSVPSVKCYVAGSLVFDRDLAYMGRHLSACDLWEVATISWPEALVTAVSTADGQLKISRHYSNPAFPCGGPKTASKGAR